MPEPDPGNPYLALGEEAGVRSLVDRFYDRMDELPEARAIRDMHATDLAPMRERLTLFLCGWLGGPPLHTERYGPTCIRSAHAPFAIDGDARDQWMSCMSDALRESPLDVELRDAVEAAFTRMAEMLRNQEE